MTNRDGTGIELLISLGPRADIVVLYGGTALPGLTLAEHRMNGGKRVASYIGAPRCENTAPSAGTDDW